MARKTAFLLATAACVFGWVAGASATTCSGSTCTISNPDTAPTTLVQADTIDTNTADTSFFGSSALGANVGGAPQNPGGSYTTTGLTVTYANTTAGNGTVTLVFNTSFASTGGTQQITSNPTTSVYAADIFIKSGAGVSTAVTSTFNYGISLGYTASKDGGISGAGLYQGTAANGGNVSYLTSNNIWGAGSANGTALGVGGQYGGDFTAASTVPNGSTSCSSAGVTCEASPTVLTSTDSTQDTAISVCDATSCGSGDGFNSSADTLTVALSGTTANLEAIFSDFDIFWGTGDCSNAPIWGNIAGLFPNTSVPEPSSLALLASAAIGFGIVRRRKRKGLATA